MDERRQQAEVAQGLSEFCKIAEIGEAETNIVLKIDKVSVTTIVSASELHGDDCLGGTRLSRTAERDRRLRIELLLPAQLDHELPLGGLAARALLAEKCTLYARGHSRRDEVY
jgi:hypothetical protein